MHYKIFSWCPFSGNSKNVDITAIQEEVITVKNEDNRRKTIISRHAAVTEEVINNYPKEIRDENIIKEAIQKNELLWNLVKGDRLQTVVDAMYSREVQSGQIIIVEGDIGNELYVSDIGTYEIFIKDKSIDTFNDNRVFGELAILFDEKRQATVKVIDSGKVWVLEQKIYQQLILRSEIQRYNQLFNFLTQVPILNTAPNEKLRKASELLKREHFPAGHVIINEGERGDKFYIISEGSVTITKENERVVGIRSKNEYFGELASLEENHLRQATVTANVPDGVTCYCLVGQEFIDHFGSIHDIKSTSKKKLTVGLIKPFQDVEYNDLKRIGTIGEGAFGRIALVRHKNNKKLTFALKILKKIEVIQKQQQNDVYNEKNIHMSCNNSFILQMYKTFRDSKCLYFLMEPCLGGDLWSLQKRRKNNKFEEQAIKFYIACALEALSYLHEHGIVYRDLKPENLVLDYKGYLKLTDFGIAKVLDSTGKTYSFAGTQEYIAPEVILEYGHNQAVDYWGLGILIYDLLVGETPFKHVTIMKTYNLILSGIEKVAFPKFVSKGAENLIKSLCKRKPVERLGCQKEKSQAVRDHSWFTDFKWDQLRNHTLKAPFLPSLKNNIDLRYFPKISEDTDIPPDENSGWDHDF